MFTNPLIELAERHDEAIVLGEKARDVRQLDGLIAKGQEFAEGADELVGGAQRERAPAGADGIEQVNQFLFLYGRGHRNLRGVEVREAGANAACSRDGTGDTKAQAIGTFVANHLERSAGSGRTVEAGRTVGIQRIAREGGEEAAHGRSEAHAGDVHQHLLTLDGGS